MGASPPQGCSKEHVEEGLRPQPGKCYPAQAPRQLAWPGFSWTRRLIFWDVECLVRHGYRARLEPQDMYQEPSVSTQRLIDIFEPAFTANKAKQELQVQLLQAQLHGSHAEHQGLLTGAGSTAQGRSQLEVMEGSHMVLIAETQKCSKPAVSPQQQAKLAASIHKLQTHIDLKPVVIKGNRGLLVATGMLHCLAQTCTLAGPLLLQRIVAGLACEDQQRQQPTMQCEEHTKLYLYCIGLLLAPAAQSLAENHQNMLQHLMGARMRNSLMAAIYRKCLRLSNSSLQEESVGRVVTLMSNDAQKLQDAMYAIHFMWGSPCYILAVLTLLWFQVGWATFVGLAIMAILAPLSGKLATKLGGLRRETLQWTDKRVGYMNEVISGIQMIKALRSEVQNAYGLTQVVKNSVWKSITKKAFYAWESSFLSKVQSARSKEAGLLRTTAVWQGLFTMTLTSGPVLAAIICLGTRALTGHNLPSAQAYTVLTLFSLLRFPMSFLPMMISMVVNALVALKRIGTFLNKPESELSKEVLDLHYPTGEVLIKDGEFSWDESVTASTLRDIQLQAKPGTLTMVVGSIGSGKSSLLGVLVGHMVKRKGTAKVGGKVAYVAQIAWIMNDTLQENVLLGDPVMDPERYKLAVKVSQLGPDLEMLSNGDLTEIGDRGVTLSGGQKQRISIARAVYSDADVYLLDDPLSAVDSHVSRALFEECISGVLKPKTIILVTNALQFLPRADNIIWMDGGKIRAQGTYTEVVARGLNVAELAHMCDDEPDQHTSSGPAYLPAGEPLIDHPTAPPKSPDHPLQLLDKSRLGLDLGKLALDVSKLGVQTTPEILKPSLDTACEPLKSGIDMARLDSDDMRDRLDSDKMCKLDLFKAKGAPRGLRVTVGAGWDDVNEGVPLLAGMDKQGGTEGAPVPIKSRRITLVRAEAGGNRNLTGEEERAAGSLSLDVLKAYIRAAGGVRMVLLLLGLFAFEQTARVYTDRWVGVWSADKYHKSLAFYIGLYFGLGCVYALTTYVRTLRFLFTCVNAAVDMHNSLLQHLLRLPKSFFDTNPSGRILNRFSRDTDIMDATLPQSLIQFTACVSQWVAILLVISIATKWFAVALVPLGALYFSIQRYYIPTARELQRIEGVSRSPIYSKFSEALSGVATIRAYRREGHFTQVSDKLMEHNANAFITQKLASAWLAMRLDILGLIVIAGCGVLVIQGGVDPGLAGLALMYALDMTRYLKQGTSMASKLEADFNSIERVLQYLTPEPEAASETDPDVAATLPGTWPSLGTIDVVDLMLKYRPELPLVLKGISFRVEGGEKVGLVGRTGSGKSSIFLALFRMVEPTSGAIYIDGVDTRTLGVRHLRSQMSIIPQDPFMFSGTVRNNLDPFEQHNDARLWEVLEAVGLKATIAKLDGALSAKVVGNGANFSLGQRQLFCMARAMLRSSRILLLDEATASVDVDTDAALQNAIRTTFAACTMLTVAHRLNTIMDSDKVVVLDHGRVVEAEHADTLLRDEAGIFTSMVEQTGRSSSRYLRSLAASSRASSTKQRSLRTSLSGCNFDGIITSPTSPYPPTPITLSPGPTPSSAPSPHSLPPISPLALTRVSSKPVDSASSSPRPDGQSWMAARPPRPRKSLSQQKRVQAPPQETTSEAGALTHAHSDSLDAPCSDASRAVQVQRSETAATEGLSCTDASTSQGENCKHVELLPSNKTETSKEELVQERAGKSGALLTHPSVADILEAESPPVIGKAFAVANSSIDKSPDVTYVATAIDEEVEAGELDVYLPTMVYLNPWSNTPPTRLSSSSDGGAPSYLEMSDSCNLSTGLTKIAYTRAPVIKSEGLVQGVKSEGPEMPHVNWS